MGAVRRAAGSASLNDGAYDKLVAKIAEPDFPLSLLPPYESSTDAGYLQYRDELAADFADWLPAPDPFEVTLGQHQLLARPVSSPSNGIDIL